MKTENSSFNKFNSDFELELKKVIDSYDIFLKKDIENFMFSTQKRLRPKFTFLFSKILGINSPLVKKIALVQELAHSASLIHDDIIDEAKLRRNYPALYKKHGSKIAVLAGDLLLSSALNILSDTNTDILKIFSNRLNLTIQGELSQNKNLNKKLDEKAYIEKTFNKTANLFIAGLEALFTISNPDKKLKKSLMDFIKNYAIAFQIKNDIKDYKNDYKNGNYTLVVLYFLMDKKSALKKAQDKMLEYKKLALDSLINIKSEDSGELLELVNSTLGS